MVMVKYGPLGFSEILGAVVLAGDNLKIVNKNGRCGPNVTHNRMLTAIAKPDT